MILVIDKPHGPSSAAVLNHIKRLIPRGMKIGHAGTLDPLASGVLVALLDRSTKLSDRVMGLPKQYVGTVRLGATSATDDAEGPIVEHGMSALPGESRVREVLSRFVGEIEQTPPDYSAVKLQGKRACDRVRRGEVVAIKSRVVRVDAIELTKLEGDALTLRIDCGKGTYVRSLARDIGAALGVGGYLADLRRTRVGPFTLDQALRPIDAVDWEQIRSKTVDFKGESGPDGVSRVFKNDARDS